MLAALLAAIVAMYLLWLSISNTSAIGCGATAAIGCDHVLNGPWSTWFAVPVSLGAVVVYTVIFAASLTIGPNAVRRHQRVAWMILLPCAVIAGGAAVWFTVLQFVAAESFCFYCLTVHGCGLIIAVLTVLRLPAGADRDRPLVSRPTVTWSIVFAAAVLGLLIIGQFLTAADAGADDFASPIDHVPVAAAGGDEFSAALSDAGSTLAGDTTSSSPRQDNGVTAGEGVRDEPVLRKIGLSNDRFVVDAYNEPVIGDPDAPTIIANLFDYTCRHCRDLYATLVKVPERYGGQVAIVMAPTPLNGSCNKFVKKSSLINKFSCRFALYALAVWNEDRAEFAAYHAWLMESAQPPPPEEARARALALIGAERFNKAVRHPWLASMIRRNTRFHSKSKGLTLPKLITREYTETLGSHQVFRFIQMKLKIRPVARTTQ